MPREIQSSSLRLSTLFFLLSTLLDTTYAANGCGNAQADAVRNIRFRVSFSPTTMDTITVSGWGGGGGPRNKIPLVTSGNNAINNTFGGREYGGGDRSSMYGTREFGSGYPYGADGAGPSSSVAGRPFPFGMWPISWGPSSHLGGEEYYGEDLDMIRPGGPLAVVTISTKDTSKWPGVSTDETYEMIGDKESLTFMMTDLVDWCHVTPQWPRKFSPGSNPSSSSKPMPRSENVIQYYRASSFALAYTGYNNSSPSPSASGYSFANSPALPSSIASSSFLGCINDTIAVALPIMDYYQASNAGLSPGAIAGIVIGCLFFVVGMYTILYNVWIWWGNRKQQRLTLIPNEDPDLGKEEGRDVENGVTETDQKERAVYQ